MEAIPRRLFKNTDVPINQKCRWSYSCIGLKALKTAKLDVSAGCLQYHFSTTDVRIWTLVWIDVAAAHMDYCGCSCVSPQWGEEPFIYVTKLKKSVFFFCFFLSEHFEMLKQTNVAFQYVCLMKIYRLWNYVRHLEELICGDQFACKSTNY